MGGWVVAGVNYLAASKTVNNVDSMNLAILRWLVLLASALLFLTRLGDRAVVSEEVRWAEVAREMQISGDYFHPTINGQLYYDKPVGSYWLILIAAKCTGGVDEFAARLPAALAGIVGIVVIMSLGRRLHDARVGVLAGAILATSFGFAFYSRRATADIETVTGVLVAIWLFERFSPRGGPWVLLLWFWMACVSLTKGLLGFALPLVVMATYSAHTAFVQRGERGFWHVLYPESRWLLNYWSILAIPLAVAVYAMPFVISSWSTGSIEGLQMVWRENVRRFIVPHNHKGPVYLYLGVIFMLAAPWSLFLPAAVMMRSPTPTRGDRLTQACFWAIFLFFTIASSRRSYYLLPVLPGMALLVSKLLLAPHDVLNRWAARLRSAGWVMLGIAFVPIGLAVLPPADVLPSPYNALPPLPARWCLGIGWLLGLLLIASICLERIRLQYMGLCLAVSLVFMGQWYLFGVAYPAADALRTRRDFLHHVRAKTDEDPTRLAVFQANDVVFDLGRIVPAYIEATELSQAIREKRIRWVLSSQRHLNAAQLTGKVVAEEPVQPWEFEEQEKNKLILWQVSP